MAAIHKRILVIEDDRDMQEAIQDILASEEYDVECCSTGPAGLEALQKAPPDLLLLDIMLGTPSEGFHIAYKMRDDERLKHVPIIIISSIGERLGMDYVRELGTDYLPAESFLEKPLKANALRETVRRVLAASLAT